MSRRRRVAFVCLAGLVAGTIAHFVDPSSDADALCFLAAGLVLGELLVLRLEDGSGVPLSFAVLIVLASSFSFGEYALAVIGAELISLVLRITDRTNVWRLSIFAERIIVAAATFGAYAAATKALDYRETVAAVLAALAAAAAAQVVVDVITRKVLRLGASFSPRGRLAWLAVASSGMLMAIGYRGVDGQGR